MTMEKPSGAESELSLLSVHGLLAHIRTSPKGPVLRMHEVELPDVSARPISNLVANVEELQEIESRLFEELVADLLRADGYDQVQVVKRHNAPGPDIVAMCHGTSGQQQLLLVECKRWRGVVGVAFVRNLAYLVDSPDYRATGGMIAATSRFTRNALDEAVRLHRWRLSLKDQDDLLAWVKLHALVIRRRWVNRIDPLGLPSGSELVRLLEKHPRLQIAAASCDACGGKVVCGEHSAWWHIDYVTYLHVCIDCLRVLVSGQIACVETHGFVDTDIPCYVPCPFCDADTSETRAIETSVSSVATPATNQFQPPAC
jgi:hypothetical protein